MPGQQTSLYVRLPIHLTEQELASFDRLRLRLQYSDGFVAYLNGHEIVRDGVSGMPAYNSTADSPRPGSDAMEYVEYDVSSSLGMLCAGENLLAIHAVNASIDQPRLVVRPELVADSLLDLTVSQSIDFRARTLNDGQWSALTVADFELLGDLTDDGRVDQQDIERMCLALQQGDSQFDLTGDGLTDHADLDVLILVGLDTSYGDANLDGRFDSGDFVLVLQAGEFEDDVRGNSGWSEGDWNCDGEFTTADIVAALQAGGYMADANVASSIYRLDSSAVASAIVTSQARWDREAKGDATQDIAEIPLSVRDQALADLRF